jgi:hypothetical protein
MGQDLSLGQLYDVQNEIMTYNKALVGPIRLLRHQAKVALLKFL